MAFKVFSVLLVLQIFALFYINYRTRNMNDRTVYGSESAKSVDSTTVTSNVLGYEPDPNGEIDVVYTWVNGSDPTFIRNLDQYLGQIDGLVETDVSKIRYNDKEELRYSLRSIEKYAPWCRKVFIVTNGQIPNWLNLSYEKVQIVTHDEIFENKDNLPTFSSHAIEVNLHRIPGLAKQFFYLNDDMMFGAPVKRQDFISDDAEFIIYLGDKLGKCATKCYWHMLANQHCDGMCNNAECQFDGGDCANVTTKLTGNVRLKRRVKTIPTYMEGLKTTNRVLNNRYGFKQRYTAAHGPIMFDVNIMTEMQKVFGNLTRTTERNKIRQKVDSQMSMLYDYFLMEEPVNIEDIFNYFDSDHTGVWEESEWSAIQVPVQDLLKRCSVDVQVNLTIVDQCESLVKAVMHEYGSRNKYKYTVKKATPNMLQFVMLQSLAQVTRELSRIKKYPKKLICINDNLPSNDFRRENQLVLSYLRKFYNDMFPMRSKFELNHNTANEFIELDEISISKNAQKLAREYFFLKDKFVF